MILRAVTNAKGRKIVQIKIFRSLIVDPALTDEMLLKLMEEFQHDYAELILRFRFKVEK